MLHDVFDLLTWGIVALQVFIYPPAGFCPPSGDAITDRRKR